MTPERIRIKGLAVQLLDLYDSLMTAVEAMEIRTLAAEKEAWDLRAKLDQAREAK